jgi:hypothetical protein
LPNRRWLDFLLLLLISLFLVTGSAAVYYSMLSTSTASILGAPVFFSAGNDSTGILTLGTNETYASLSLNAYPNVTCYYDQAVNVTANANRDIRLRHVSISPLDNDPSVSNFTSIVFRLIRGNGTELGTLTYTTTGTVWNRPAPTGYVTIASGEKWTIKVEITAAAGSRSGISTNIVVAIDVR